MVNKEKSDYLLSKGFDVTGKAKGKTKRKKARVAINLRLPADLIPRIESALAVRSVKIPRHQWLLECIVERLESEGL